MIRKATFIVFIAFLIDIQIGNAQSSEFSYQGKLEVGVTPANGNYDFEFRLFDAAAAGNQVGLTVSRNSVSVNNGTFSESLDFGAGSFPGADRWIEVWVRPTGGGGFQQLLPRTRINSTPYSVKSLNAETAANATTATTASNSLQLGGLAANQFVLTTDPRMTDARTPTAGSANYIQNQNTGAQAASNFNISGDGTAGGTLRGSIVRANQFNIGNDRVLSTAGLSNMFVGVNTGTANSTGNANVFVGISAGGANTTGAGNTFVGTSSGSSNIDGSANSFFGRSAGDANTTGNDNSFFGRSAGLVNIGGDRNSFFGRSAGAGNTASDNSFFGYNAGLSVTTGDSNAFFGGLAGAASTVGSGNTFIGYGAGNANTSGVTNTFVGLNAGFSNTSGGANTAIGAGANVDAGIDFSTAIGAGTTVSTSSTIQLGRSNGLETVRIPGRLALLDLGSAGSTSLCRNNLITGQQIASCSSSYRYKTNIGSFRSGFDLVSRLRPITFDWKDGGMRDVGLGAEDVAAIEPLLVTYNSKGEVEGVKYDRIGVVLINAIKEQQRRIDLLTEYICAKDPAAALCKEKK